MDSSNLSLYEDTLKFYFVLTGNHQGWNDVHPMKFARQKLLGNVCRENIIDVSPFECEELSHNFTKKNIVIFNEFEGECFEKIRKTPAMLLGPRAVISSFMDNTTIPGTNSPIFNLSMRNLIICLSALGAQEKHKYRQLIHYMGGYCIDQLTENVTHLVTNSVKSKKYELAVIRNMKVMKPSWIDDVWTVSSEDTILATNAQFDKHKVPVFYNLSVTTTGLNKKDKRDVEQLVVNNGGKYYGEFSGTLINVVIAKRKSEQTPKLKAALNAMKDCLCVEWIVDSAKKGYALPLDNYRIDLQAKKSTSTPEKRGSGTRDTTGVNLSAEMSNIQFTGAFNETALSNLSGVSDCSAFSNRRSTEATDNDLAYKAVFEKLNLPDAKKAGLFLDGCNVYICGFTSEEKEKIVKILNAGGATRYDTINSNLSHILVGNPSKKDIAMLQTVRNDATLVKLEWLVDSIAMKTAISDCQKYVYRLGGGKENNLNDDVATAPSPASKRNILSMSGISSKQANPKRLNFDGNASNASIGTITPDKRQENENMESSLLDQYLVPQEAQPTTPIAGTSKARNMFKVPEPIAKPLLIAESEDYTESEDNSEVTQDTVKYLANKKVYIHGFSDDSTEYMVTDCEQAGAEVHMNQNYRGIIDYLILPIDAMTRDDITIKAKVTVNQNWLINAKRLNQVTDVPYFFEPIFFQEDLKPLAGLVVALSLYASDERNFLMQLGQILGADVQENFVRQNRPILICPKPESSKYNAAIRWNSPIVNKDWLLDCYKQARRLSLKNYLVGDSILPMDDIEEYDEIFNSQPLANEIQLHKRDNSENKPIEKTPQYSNRRVEELRAGGSKSKSPSSRQQNIASPSTPYDGEVDYSDFDTPMREDLNRIRKELAAMTPQTKRRCLEEDGIRTPEYATTPYMIEQKRKQLEEERAEYGTPSDKAKEKEKTPWTEYKRRFWKNVLGDQYESPSQCYEASSTQEIPCTQLNDSIRPTGRQLNYEPEGGPNAPDESEADRNIQKLADFIKNRKDVDDDYGNHVALPNTVPTDTEMPNSEQHEIIGWREPCENVATVNQLAGTKKSRTKCFSISCMSDGLQEHIIKKIRELKGEVCQNLLKYDSECTHLVVEKLGSSEKVLSCISSGKWILGLEYIEKSWEAGHFLDEELYEWGNPRSLLDLSTSDVAIGCAAYRWRRKVQSSALDNRPFTNFQIILLTNKNDGIRTMVEAGGGKIIDINPGKPLCKQTSYLIDATHVICQQKFTKLTAEDYAALKEANVPAVTLNFLRTCIVEEKTPDVKKYLFTTK